MEEKVSIIRWTDDEAVLCDGNWHFAELETGEKKIVCCRFDEETKSNWFWWGANHELSIEDFSCWSTRPIDQLETADVEIIQDVEVMDA
jgi:hypothetical protein